MEAPTLTPTTDTPNMHRIAAISVDQALTFYQKNNLQFNPYNAYTTTYAYLIDDVVVAALTLTPEYPCHNYSTYLLGNTTALSHVVTTFQHRLKGYQRALMLHTFETLGESLMLKVTHDNYPAINLYTSLGFYQVPGDHHMTLKFDGGKGYASCRLHCDQANSLTKLLRSYGVNILPVKDLHVTLMYDEANPLIPHKPLYTQYPAHIESIGFLGEGKWAALVLHLDVPSLASRHEHLKTLGFTHSYPEFKPHLSLMYSQSAKDLHNVKRALTDIKKMSPLMLMAEDWTKLVD